MNSLLTKYGRTVEEKQKEKKQFTSISAKFLFRFNGVHKNVRE